MSRALAIVRDQMARNKDGFLARLLKHTQRQPRRADQEIGCLLWTGACNNDNYPTLNVWFKGKHRKACVHHLTLALFSGKDVPEGMERDHTCNTRNCCEPRHLEVVTHLENLRRARERKRVSLAEVNAAITAGMKYYNEQVNKGATQ